MDDVLKKLGAFARRRRRWLIAGGGAIVFIAVVLIALPYGVRYAVADWLRQDGVRTASVSDVSIDYLEPSITITGIESRDTDGKVLRLGRVALALDVGALWNRRFHVRSLAIADGRIEVTQTREGQFRLAGIPISAPVAAPPPSARSEPSRWQIGLDETAIDALTVAFHAPGGTQEFTVNNARLGSLAMWAGDAKTALQLAMALGGGSSVNIGGEATPLGQAPSMEIDLAVNALDLSRAQLIPGLEGLAGALSGKAKLSAATSADKGPQLHIDGNLAVQGFEIGQGQGHPSLASLDWTGDANVAVTPNGAITGHIQGALNLGRLAAAGDAFSSGSLTGLDARASFDPKKGLEAQTTGALDITGPSFDLGGAKGGGERLRWKGTIRATQGRDESYRVEAKGNLEALSTAYESGGASLVERSEVSVARFAVDGLDAKVEKSASGSVRLDLAGTFMASGVKGSAADEGFAEESASWTGTIGALSEPDKRPEVALDGALASKGLALDLKSAGYKIAQREINWRGTAKLGGEMGPSMAATVDFAGTTIDAPERKTRLIDFDQVSLQNATMTPGGGIAMDRLEARNLRAVGPAGATDPEAFAVNIGAIRTDALAFDGASRLEVRRIAVNDADISVERDDKGAIQLLGVLAALGGGGTGQPGEPFRVSVGETTLGGKSRIDFVDHSVEPAAKIAFGPIALKLGAIDTAAADRAVPIDLKADIGRYAKLNLAGSAKPFAKKLDVDVQGKIAGFELTSLAGYMSQYLGYDLSRGRLDSELHAKIVDGALQSTSQLTITNLDVKQAESDASRSLKKHIEIPLETALSLLRDSNDVIRLNLPVTGDIANPNFDLSDAINTAIGNAVKQTLTTLLTVVFPVGGLIMAIADSSGDKGLKFKPVLFQGGEVDFDDASKALLDALAKLLEARPGVKITTCGVATERDAADILRVRKEKALAEAKRRTLSTDGVVKPDDVAPVTRDELYDLSQRRSEAVKDYLIARPGVDETRVFTCAPNVAKEASAEPRAEITL